MEQRIYEEQNRDLSPERKAGEPRAVDETLGRRDPIEPRQRRPIKTRDLTNPYGGNEHIIKPEPMERYVPSVGNVIEESIQPDSLLKKAQDDNQKKQWLNCDKKLSQILESSQTDQRLKEAAIRLSEYNLLAWGQEAYQKARQTREWAEARQPYEKLKNSKDINGNQKLKACELLKRIDNNEAVNLMPAGSLVLDFLPLSGEIHLAIKNPDLSEETETFKTMTEMEKLKQKLKHEKRILISADAGRSTVADYDFTKVFPMMVVWRDPKLHQAAKDINELCNEPLSLKDCATAVLFPRNAGQQELLGLNWSDKDRARAWEGAEIFPKESGISDVVTSPWNRRGLLGWAYEKLTLKPLKEELINTLQTKKGVLIFFSHGDRDGISLLDGTKLTAVDVSNLDLSKNKPVVLIFSCEAAKREEKADKSFASDSIVEALKRAGAKAVFGFEEKVDAAESISDALKFTGAFKPSQQEKERKTTVGEALERMILEIQRKKGPKTMLKVQRENEMVRRLSSGA